MSETILYYLDSLKQEVLNASYFELFCLFLLIALLINITMNLISEQKKPIVNKKT